MGAGRDLKVILKDKHEIRIAKFETGTGKIGSGEKGITDIFVPTFAMFYP